MGPIRQMEIGGFRAILSPLPLQFVKEDSTRSMIIHGRNGTGKSSITDAWEWFHTEKIAHLAREGAGRSAFPHRHAKAGETFIEVLFADDELGTIRLTFDHSRVSIPISDGDIAKLRALAPHPCHIRFGDLTRFVYLRKAEKYDALAELMGFTAQVELQKVLRRTLRQLNEELETRQQNVDEIESALSGLLEVANVEESTILKSLNKLLARHGVEAGRSIGGLQEPAAALTTLVETDARSQELAGITILKSAIEGVRLPTDLQTELSSYAEVAQTFKKDESATVGLLLLGLYEQGQDVLARRKET
ncbi:MAG: AAA family ATPase [Anaerolineae bacterium]